MNLTELKSFIRLRDKHVPISIMLVIGFLMLGSVALIAFRVDRMRADFNEARRQLDAYRAEVWQMEQMNEPAANLELREELARFSSARNAAALIEDITAAGKQFDISFASISPKDKTELAPDEKAYLPNLARVPVEMTVKGSYQNIALFLSQLSRLKNAVIRVDEFRLMPSASNSEILSGPLKVSVFVPQDETKPLDSLNTNLPVELRRTGKTRFREFGRNPFNKWVEHAVEHDIVLEGIMYDVSQPVVLISGKIWHVGDKIGNAKIIEIKPTSIVIERYGKQETVRLRTG